MARPSVLVTYKLPAAVISKLEAVAHVDVHKAGLLSHDELVERVGGKQALVVAGLDTIDKAVIDAGTELKIIANVAVGFNNIDVPHARSKGIAVTNTPDVLTES